VEGKIEFMVSYSQRYLFSANPDTNHNANSTNPNRNSKGNPTPINPINPTNPNNPDTRYRCEYGTLNSMFAPWGLKDYIMTYRVGQIKRGHTVYFAVNSVSLNRFFW